MVFLFDIKESYSNRRDIYTYNGGFIPFPSYIDKCDLRRIVDDELKNRIIMKNNVRENILKILYSNLEYELNSHIIDYR